MREVLEAIWANGAVSKPLHVACYRRNDDMTGPALIVAKGAPRACKPAPKVEWPDPPLKPHRSSRPRKRKG